jgi:hypothetical protein
MADELAGAMFEFFTTVYDESTVNPTMDGSSASFTHDLPIPSPDSITVTTEFGVMEEPANLTTISASGPSPYHVAYDHSDDEENNVEMTEDVNEDVEALQQGLAQMHLTPVPGMSAHILHLPVEVEPEHVHDENEDEESDGVNDTGAEADIDTDDLDAGAESTFVDESGDDTLGGGILTPTTTITV